MSCSVGQSGNKSLCKKKSRLQCGATLSTAANHMIAGGPQTAVLPAPKDENDRKETVGSAEEQQQLLRSVDVHWQGDWTRPAAHYTTAAAAAAAATVVYCALQRPPPPPWGHILPSSPMSFVRTTSDVFADGSRQSTAGHMTPNTVKWKKTTTNVCILCKEICWNFTHSIFLPAWGRRWRTAANGNPRLVMYANATHSRSGLSLNANINSWSRVVLGSSWLLQTLQVLVASKITSLDVLATKDTMTNWSVADWRFFSCSPWQQWD